MVGLAAGNAREDWLRGLDLNLRRLAGVSEAQLSGSLLPKS